MKLSSIISDTRDLDNVWFTSSQKTLPPGRLLYLCAWGFIVGALAGGAVAIFRIITSSAYQLFLNFASAPDPVSGSWFFIFVIALLFALITGYLIRNPNIRFGGVSWEYYAIADGQPRPWRTIFLPKFLGTMLVMSMGVSVGHAEPCVQMSAAAALGLSRDQRNNVMKRRFFVLGGCSAGLSAAFSAPFAGVAYVYEVMRLKMDSAIFVFLLSGCLGVYVTETRLFGLGMILPFGDVALPGLLQSLWLVPLAFLAGLAGILYTVVLRGSVKLYDRQKLLSPCLRPIIVFLAAAVLLFAYPAVTGNGFSIFSAIQSGDAFLGYLCFFFCAKLLFTAFCYGSGIPAGVMMPLLCVGGVSGGVYANILLALGFIPPSFVNLMVILGMAGTFACAEQAPVTAMLIVLELTGAWNAAPFMLFVVAAAVFCGRVFKIKAI